MAAAEGKRSANSAKPLAPRLAADGLDLVDLATARDGEFDHVELCGQLPDGFDEPLLVKAAVLRSVDLVGSRLASSRFVDVAISGSDLSGADFDSASLTRVEIRECRLSGVQFGRARLRDVRFVDCRLDDANFRFSTGEHVRFERCRLSGAEFVGASFDGVAWWDCDLTGAEMSKITVVNGQLHGSIIDGLRGASSLAPIALDAAQAPVFADHLLASFGIVVTDRSD